MFILQLAYLFIAIAVGGFLLLFAVSSLREKRPRAAVVSIIALILIEGGGYMWYLAFSDQPYLLAIPPVALAVLGILFFAPIGPNHPLRIGTISAKVDERDVMFAREDYVSGSREYEAYYAQHPEHKELDDRLRALPELLEPGGRYYDAERSRSIDAIFDQIQSLVNDVDGPVEDTAMNAEPAEITATIKDIVKRSGADEVGIARLNPMYVYSHVGRGPEPWGAPIKNKHKYAIAFTVEMNYEHVEAAPDLPITEETARQYLRATNISIALAEYIRALGYPARAHISGSNYQIMLPPVAHEAGLGELGRLGYLVTPKFGPRVRLGVVTTDLPLVLDEPITFGLQDFCEKCLKCAANCPSAAIVKNGKSDQRGVEKWQLDIERCYRYWRLAGTDCGLCMKVCPYSHPPTLVHNIVRAGTMRSSIARTMAVWGDDLFYGRKARFERLES